MRTRRSPRNQETLWRALGGQPEPSTHRDDVALYERLLARSGLKQRDRRAFERSLASAKMRRAAKVSS